MGNCIFSGPLCICDLFLPLTGVAEQFALAEAAMNAWSSHDVENNVTGSTIPVQGINSTVIISYKEPFCSGKVLWMLKVLHGTTDANKEPSFLRV